MKTGASKRGAGHIEKIGRILRSVRAYALAHIATVGDPCVSPWIVGTVAVQAPLDVVVVITTIRTVIIIVVTIGKCAAKRDASAEQPPRVLVVVATIPVAAIVAPTAATVTVATTIVSVVVFIAVFPAAVIVVIPFAATMIPHFGEKRRVLCLHGRLLRLDGDGRGLAA